MRITDIARLAHVSPATVSKVLNGHDQSISEETRARVLQVVQENNYTPYSKVWNNRATQTQTLAIFLKNGLTAPALSGFLSVVQQAGYAPLLFDSFNSQQQQQENFHTLENRHVDAILWQPVSLPINPEDVDFLTSHSTHISLLVEQAEDFPANLNSDTSNSGNHKRDSLKRASQRVSPIVFAPWHELGYRAGSELAKLGHTSLGIVGSGLAWCQSHSFSEEAFLSGVNQALFDTANTSETHVYDSVSHINFEAVESGGVTALLSLGEENTAELMAQLANMHLRVPHDVSVLSIQLDTQSPASSFTLHARNFGVFLAQQLLAQMSDSSTSPISPDYQSAISLNGLQTLASPHQSHHHGGILVVGSMNLDRYFAVPQLPREGISVITNRTAMYAGGKGTNQAIGAARLGSSVSLIGKTGSDLYADKLLNTLSAEGVDTSGVVRDSQQHTGEAFIFVNNEGSSMVTVLSGANDALTSQEVLAQEKLFEQADFCLIQTEIPRDTVFTACTLAHQHGCQIIMKPASISSLDAELLSLVDILVPNERELRAICSHFEPKAASPFPEGTELAESTKITSSLEQLSVEQLFAHGVHDVVVTQGIHGSTWYRCKTDQAATAVLSTHYPSVDYPTVDDTGAGDAFIAALAHCLNEGFTMDYALKRATIAAGYSTTHQGAAQSTIDSFTLEAQVEAKITFLHS